MTPQEASQLKIADRIVHKPSGNSGFISRIASLTIQVDYDVGKQAGKRGIFYFHMPEDWEKE